MTAMMDAVARDNLGTTIGSFYGKGKANGGVRRLYVCQSGRRKLVTKEGTGPVIVVLYGLIEAAIGDQTRLSQGPRLSLRGLTRAP